MEIDKKINILDKEKMENKNRFDIFDKNFVVDNTNYSSIYILNRHLINGLRSLKIDTSICLNSTHALNSNQCYANFNYLTLKDAQNIIYLLKRANGIFGRKVWAISNRRTNYLIFEYGLYALIKDLHKNNIIDLRKQINNMHIRLQIKGGNLDIGITTSKIFGNDIENNLPIWDEKIVLFLSKEQRDIIRELKSFLGFNTEGIIGLICVMYSFKSIFGHCREGNTKIGDFYDQDLIQCDSEIISREKYYLLIDNIIIYLIENYRNELDKYYKRLMCLSKLKEEKNRFKK